MSKADKRNRSAVIKLILGIFFIVLGLGFVIFGLLHLDIVLYEHKIISHHFGGILAGLLVPLFFGGCSIFLGIVLIKTRWNIL